MPEHASEVTAAGIARLAGVGRAAVSNWRRRHDDFPKPVGGSDTSPTYELSAVERWLQEQGKLPSVPLHERLWQRADSHPEGVPAALRVAGSLLMLLQGDPAISVSYSADTDDEFAARLPAEMETVLTARFGPEHPVRIPDRLDDAVPLLRTAAKFAEDTGPAETYEFLFGRYLDANSRQFTLTPPGPAELMAALAGESPGSVLDPACGSGALLCASEAAESVHAQEIDPELAALTALRLAMATDPAVRVRVRSGDSLREDAFRELAVDAVLCHPPFNDRNWGHDELGYDARWEYGFPARTESELAWLQHSLAHVRDGGTVVMLMPPAAASRRSGRRVRADLLRRGALRAVVALPAGSAPPYGLPLHLWVLRKPDPEGRPPGDLLVFDAAGIPGHGPERTPWYAVSAAVLDTWAAFDRHGSVPDRPGLNRTLPVVELLDDEVDVTPARHLPPPTAEGGAAALESVRDRLARTLRRTAETAPVPPAAGEPARWPTTTVGELARAGALLMRPGGGGTARADGSAAAHAVLTEHDVVVGGAPTGLLPPGRPDGTVEEPVLVEEGDVVVPVLGGGAVARVVDGASAGAALGRNVYLLRPDTAALDPWFLAGFLRGTANNRQASSFASTSTRLDVRRLQVPRLPLADQRRYGERFRTLAAFEETLRQATALGDQLIQGLYDGLTDGTVRPG
ncbi:N-6 DNA methylase [Actinacidiphila bryophytorum]|uniref:N-6 DNA Methylase n=1 Tax=Actinacidiphila bryophytorum TaxID=1436133 RepID=A0A9W4H0D3_9ACTN|nr:N-6 DNA methylase [Actinacidiphila bryophytorum]MBM9438685.1 N-6 DNA methylase [Actinacidiphila bryophytorum]MBN6543914.1 N-6 DNA methylase [Actinacidiphila bryophytorum]CAG7637095.1 N-6 DNA Methylase [Actinacidiphila bryophytorum]